MDQLAVERACPICGRLNDKQRSHPYSKDSWRLTTCASCGLLYLTNPPAYVELEEDLAWERTFAAETQKRRKRNPTLRKLGRLPRAALQGLTGRDKLLHLARVYFRPGKIPDVGCSDGHTLDNFPFEYIPCGIEISRELSQQASRHFEPRGGYVVQKDAIGGLSELGSEEFTGIIMTSYLEHEKDLRQVLSAVQRVMLPGAGLIAKVPNYASWNRVVRGSRWCGLRFPIHVNYFTPRLFARVLTEAGFVIQRFNFGDRLPTSDTMWIVAKKPEGL